MLSRPTTRRPPPGRCRPKMRLRPARYSRSPGSIRRSLAWVRTHDSRQVPRQILLPVRARLHRGPGTWRCASRAFPSWPPPRSKRSRCGTGQASCPATRIFRCSRLHRAAGTGGRGPPRRCPRRRREPCLEAYGEGERAPLAFDCLGAPCPAPRTCPARRVGGATSRHAPSTWRGTCCSGASPPTSGRWPPSARSKNRCGGWRLPRTAKLRELGLQVAAACAAEPACAWYGRARESRWPPRWRAMPGRTSTRARPRPPPPALWASREPPRRHPRAAPRVAHLLRPACVPADIPATLL